MSGDFQECPSIVRTAVPPRPSDFRIEKEIGQGSFSTVYVVREIATGSQFAMKVVNKQYVQRNRAVDSVLMEKAVLTRTNHVFIIRLHCTFQDASSLYYVLEYARHGELLSYLNRLTSFDIPCARFYTAEILVALEYLHGQSIVHRDLKPENVLLTDNMHIKLADFGSAIILNDPKVKAPGFTGTPEYVSPEMLSPHSAFEDDNGGSSQGSTNPCSSTDLTYLMDFWALGCVLYQLISGRSPFRPERDRHPYETFGKIFNLSYTFMDGFDPDAKDLVQRLLVIDPLKRLGSPTSGGPSGLHTHPFFTGVEWDTLPNQTPPELVPNIVPIAPAGWDTLPANLEDQKYHLYSEFNLAIGKLTDGDRTHYFTLQEQQNPYHRFTRNRLILKQGILFKRRGLFARKRMFLLTEGPHLFYVDMDSVQLKGEVPWSSFLTLEAKSDRLFFIRVPNRTFYLEDPSGHASDWVEAIAAVRQLYFADSERLGQKSSPTTAPPTEASGSDCVSGITNG
ncbi:hypothetical protein EG68_03362 [Paragonimus skrjabini miyazakii]|uniref:3-phosphoinositide-dependent protein kinase 1 n=1 Tax=Paragonimus skrjabini miyazakii TaxID=59628 RepID=A0A8S9YXN1_9TREM|nr:hypothetical protein EG68_03362 [Paragonimus skrjabini miyazakii]